MGKYIVEISAHGNQPARSAKIDIRFAQVEIKKPKKERFSFQPQIPSSVSVFAVLAKELDPPPGIKPLEWMLLTNTVVSTFEEAVEKIQWYGVRWTIEEFHKILKSGCRVEACRLSTVTKLEKYLTLFIVIAWRLHWITHINRQAPENPCTSVFSELEWKALYCKTHKTKQVPKKAPSTRHAIRWLAQLGGFLARKGDGEPGIITLWRGWQRLNDITEDWLLFSGP